MSATVSDISRIVGQIFTVDGEYLLTAFVRTQVIYLALLDSLFRFFCLDILYTLLRNMQRHSFISELMTSSRHNNHTLLDER